MKKTYYYYSAVAIQNESISYIKGVTYTTEKGMMNKKEMLHGIMFI